MSKKDFQAIARALHIAKVTYSFSIEGNLANIAARERIADVCAATNPRFDRARFIEACETGACKGMKKSA